MSKRRALSRSLIVASGSFASLSVSAARERKAGASDAAAATTSASMEGSVSSLEIFMMGPGSRVVNLVAVRLAFSENAKMRHRSALPSKPVHGKQPGSRIIPKTLNKPHHPMREARSCGKAQQRSSPSRYGITRRLELFSDSSPCYRTTNFTAKYRPQHPHPGSRLIAGLLSGF